MTKNYFIVTRVTMANEAKGKKYNWGTESETIGGLISFLVSKGISRDEIKIQESRTTKEGNMDIFLKGKHVAWCFQTQEEQRAFLGL